MNQCKEQGLERYDAKYLRSIAAKITNLLSCWDARFFIDYWVEHELGKILADYEEETRQIEQKEGHAEVSDEMRNSL